MTEEYPRLYHLTVRRPDTVVAAAFCSFTSDSDHLVVARGQWLELFQITEDERLTLVTRRNTYSSIRCIASIGIPGYVHQQLVVTSDSGEISLLKFDEQLQELFEVSSEPLALSKLRHEFPGEHLAVDPRGRIAVVAGISRARSVCIFDDMGINAPPIEQNLSSLFCYAMIPVDRGYENPAFAALERFRFSSKQLSMYEFNLGLNIVSKLWSVEVLDTCDVIVGLPGSRNETFGVFVFEGSKVLFRDGTTGAVKAECRLDCKENRDAEVEEDFVLCATLLELGFQEYYVLACTKSGKLVAVTLDMNTDASSDTKNGAAATRNLKVFSVEVSEASADDFASVCSLVVGKQGLVFVANNSGDHTLFQASTETETGEAALKFELITTLGNISPVTTSLLQKSQLVISKGSEIRSAGLAMVRPGFSVDELASTPLPGIPTAVFSTSRYPDEEFDTLIVITFDNDTTTSLEVAEDGAVGEISETDSGIATNLTTIGITKLTNGVVQIHSRGLRYVVNARGKAPAIVPWLTPSQNSHIVFWAATFTQVAVGLSDKRVVYFEEKDGVLQKLQQSIEVRSDITAMCFKSNARSELRSSGLILALADETLREYDVPAMKQKQIASLSFIASSLVHSQLTHNKTEVLYVGHVNGTLSVIQEGETLIRLLGSSPVKLESFRGQAKLVAVSSRVWLINNEGTAVPLIGDALHRLSSCAEFRTADLPQGCMIGVKPSSLEVIYIQNDHERTKLSIELSNSLNAAPSSAAIVRTSHSGNAYISLQDGSFSRTEDFKEVEPANTSPASFGSPRAATNVRFESAGKECLTQAKGSTISTFEYFEDGNLGHLHDTDVGDSCTALLAFNGRLLASSGKSLILYELGQKQLLRQSGILLDQCTSIRALRASRNLVFVGDSRRSVQVVRYSQENGFCLVAEDPVPRSVNSLLVLDPKTVCIGDQYGNIAVLRTQLSGVANNSTEVSSLKLVAHFYIPDAIVGLHRGSLSPVAAAEAIIYVGLQGTIGALIPSISNSEYGFVKKLEETLSGLGQYDWQRRLKFRSYYSPIRNVVDGDFLEAAIKELHLGSQSEEDMTSLQISEIMDSNLVAIGNRLKNIRLRSITDTL